MSSLRSNRAAQPISPLSVADTDGRLATATGYTIMRLSSTAQGILYHNGTAASAGQALTDPALPGF